jgi:membrane protease YdiL (CAAX protease family)
MMRFATELAILVGVGLAVTLLFSLVIYPALGLPGRGPVPFRTLVLALVVTRFIRATGRSWAAFGLAWNLRWWHAAAIVVVVLLAKVIVIQPLSDWLRAVVNVAPSDYTFFRHIEGNPLALGLWLIIAWVVGGFAEEMVFRGYVMRTTAEVFGSGRGAWAGALVAQALIFGLGHAYLGWGGAVSGTLSALLYGGAVLAARGSLWPVIVAHGLWDSLGFVALYVKGVPDL